MMKALRKCVVMLIAMSMACPMAAQSSNGGIEDLVNSTKELLGLFKRKKPKTESVQTASLVDGVAAVDASAQSGGFRIVTGHPDLKVRVQRCEASGKTCVIDLILENTGSKDVKMRFMGGNNSGYKTTAYDDEANTYGEGQITVRVGNHNLTAYDFYEDLLSEVPIKARIQIEGVPEAATMFRRIDFAVMCDSWYSGGYNKIKFYNVPISRDGE